jgi:hypothetical protein
MTHERYEDYMKRKLKELEMKSQWKDVEWEKEEQASLQSDMVNHPPHYNQQGIECIEAIHAATGEGFEYYLQGNIMKYLWRYRYKNGNEDLNKARWYLDKLIEVRNES